MGGGRQIGATDDAAEGFKAIARYDAGVPDAAVMQEVHGTSAGPGLAYVNRLKDIGARMSTLLERELQGLRADCEHAAKSIDELHELDEQIAAMLDSIDTEPQSGGTPTAADTEWSTGSSPATGSGKRSFK